MDVDILRIVVRALGGICALCCGGVVVIALVGHEVPPTLGSIASVCAGALVGILVTPRHPPQPAAGTTNPANSK